MLELLPTDDQSADLVRRMAIGDQDALETLYDSTVKRLYPYALRIVRDPGLAEEVIEDTLFQAWREASRFDIARGKVIAWLMTICRSRALDALRRADPSECVEDADVFRSHLMSYTDEPQQVLSRADATNAVQAALRKLPPGERQTVNLAFFCGMTHQEIANHWKMPIGSVKTIMHRAFAQLRLSLVSAR